MSFAVLELLAVISLMTSHLKGAIIEGPQNVIYFPGQGNIELKCNVTGIPLWMVNGTTFKLSELSDGELPGHNRTGANIIIESPVNNTKYVCESLFLDHTIQSEAAFVYIAAAPNVVPDVMIANNSVTLDNDNVTLLLSWGEPFNNFDPIIFYTVKCSSDISCPPDFNTTDNTTRNYTINNLISGINYTFSVIAVNSINQSLPGTLIITAPSVPGKVAEVVLICKPVNLHNICDLSWKPITVGNGPLDQPLVYQVIVDISVPVINAASSTTALTFIASSLPDGVFVDNITVIINAVNRFGYGPNSTSNSVEIMSSSIINATAILSVPHISTAFHSIIVTCTIHMSSEADKCQVIVGGDNMFRSGSSSITNRMATVEFSGLACGVLNTIMAGGTLNGSLVGPTSSFGTITGPCPVITITPMLFPSYASGSGSVVPDNTTFLLSQGTFNVTCNVTDQVPLWRVNDVTYTVNQLDDGDLPDHTQINTANKSTLVTISPVNSTKYVCLVIEDNKDILSNSVIIHVAAVPSKILAISVTSEFISTKGDNVTLVLSWNEPMDNFYPILSYTISCTSKSRCPVTVTVYNETRVSLTNLMPGAIYTFSVTATNLIGDGQPGILNTTTVSFPDKISGVDLVCFPSNMMTECNAEWDAVRMVASSDLLTGVVIYQIVYFEAMLNFTTTNNLLVFQAQPVSDEIYIDNVTIIVTAINNFGTGEPSDAVFDTIFAASVTDAVAVLDTPSQYRDMHSVTVTCKIHPESEAELCEVVLIASGNLTRIGNAPIINGLATVVVDGLHCRVVYNITTGGKLNGTLVGPRSLHGTIIAGPCPINSVNTISDTENDSFSGGLVGGLIGTIIGTMIQGAGYILVYVLVKRYYLDGKQVEVAAKRTDFIWENEHTDVYSVRTNQPPTGIIELENFDQTNQPPTGDIELENFANENSHDDDDFDEDDDCGYEDYTRGDDLVEAEIHLYGNCQSVQTQPEVPLEDIPWFHGKISRREVVRRLNAAKNGMFIIRESTSHPGDYALSVSAENGVFHYHIRKNENDQVSINGKEFYDNLVFLVEHYKDKKHGLPMKLRIPVDKKEISEVMLEITAAKLAKEDETIAQQRAKHQMTGIVTEDLPNQPTYGEVKNPTEKNT